MKIKKESSQKLKKARVLHCSSAHSRYDTRIFLKECKSLSHAGYEVSYLVADGRTDEDIDNIKISSVRQCLSRKDRLVKASSDFFEKAISLDVEIYHLHDPELITLGLRLKKKGKKVIFDCHESVSRQILSKPYIPHMFKHSFSLFYSYVEKWVLSKFDIVIAATPLILYDIKRIKAKTVLVNNYPIVNELSTNAVYSSRLNEISYVGGISPIRGVEELINSLEYTKSNPVLNLVGVYTPIEFKAKLLCLNGWEKVKILAFLIAVVYSQYWLLHESEL
jgi:glycosyltransferase involved in cell wall biosynthesis